MLSIRISVKVPPCIINVQKCYKQIQHFLSDRLETPTWSPHLSMLPSLEKVKSGCTPTAFKASAELLTPFGVKVRRQHSVHPRITQPMQMLGIQAVRTVMTGQCSLQFLWRELSMHCASIIEVLLENVWSLSDRARTLKGFDWLEHHYQHEYFNFYMLITCHFTS